MKQVDSATDHITIVRDGQAGMCMPSDLINAVDKVSQLCLVLPVVVLYPERMSCLWMLSGLCSYNKGYTDINPFKCVNTWVK